MKVNINPISVNKCWQGRRFKTPDYKTYENELLYKLPDIKMCKGELTIKIEFGFSSKLKDIDNPLKPFLDILQKKYEFNDRDIFRLEVDKKIVPKGEEYIEFNIYRCSR
jgi:Holliday junction resolvase RusA-like endonuclease